MPEYLAPGVYIEEVSFRAKTIEGVSTSTAGFIGPTRFGPTHGEPELLTSFTEFQRVYGSLDQLVYRATDGTQRRMHNYLAHGVRSFFDEGGRRLYVMRVFNPAENGGDGHASATIPAQPGDDGSRINLQARFPGSGGSFRVSTTARVSGNVLIPLPADPANPGANETPSVNGVRNRDLVWIFRGQQANQTGLYRAESVDDPNNPQRRTWLFANDAGTTINLAELNVTTEPHDEVRIVTVDVDIEALDPANGAVLDSKVWQNLSFHPERADSLSRVFARQLTRRSDELTNPIIFEPVNGAQDDAQALDNPVQIATLLFEQSRGASDLIELSGIVRRGAANLDGVDADGLVTALGNFSVRDLLNRTVLDHRLLPAYAWRFSTLLDDGNDGARPTAGDFEGEDADDPNQVTGLRAFEGIPDISIIAAPGHTAHVADDEEELAQSDQITRHLIGHAERMRYRIAVLDSRDGESISDVRRLRGRMDSTHAALYYPWITIMDPVTEEQINIPPSATMAGIYARNDVDHGVHKAPANETIRQAIGLETLLNKAQQDVLNPEGINCLRFFEGRGYRVWGARTISSDPEWKYVQLRRYFAYLERSIERGTQWVVFENNHEPLWARVRRTVEDFMFNEWSSERLMGEKPELAYFVRCDRSTMTQNDIDNGRLICLVGVSPVRPA